MWYFYEGSQSECPLVSGSVSGRQSRQIGNLCFQQFDQKAVYSSVNKHPQVTGQDVCECETLPDLPVEGAAKFFACAVVVTGAGHALPEFSKRRLFLNRIPVAVPGKRDFI